MRAKKTGGKMKFQGIFLSLNIFSRNQNVSGNKNAFVNFRYPRHEAYE
jgi:hypothetical protein